MAHALRARRSTYLDLASPEHWPALPCENWWTGEDSNLRSPQGAADLQSAGFSHSPTRPARGNLRRKKADRQSLRFQKKNENERHPPAQFSAKKTGLAHTVGHFPLTTSNQKISWRRELNPRPSDYKSDALPTELRQHGANVRRITNRASELQGDIKSHKHVACQLGSAPIPSTQ